MLSYTGLRRSDQASLLGCTGPSAATVKSQCSAGSAQACIPLPGDGRYLAWGCRCLCGPLPQLIACPPRRRQTTAYLAPHAAVTAQHCATRACNNSCMSSNSCMATCHGRPRALPPRCFPAVANRNLPVAVVRGRLQAGRTSLPQRGGSCSCSSRDACSLRARRAASLPRAPPSAACTRKDHFHSAIIVEGTYVLQLYMHLLLCGGSLTSQLQEQYLEPQCKSS